MNIRLLRSKMALHGDTDKSLAEYLDIGTSTISNKINNKADWTNTEMLRIKARYSLNDKEYLEIFNKEVVFNESK